MSKIMKKLLGFVLIAFAMVLSWIIMSGFIKYEKNMYDFNPIFLGIAVLAYIVIICFVFKHILKKLEKFKHIEYIMFIIFTIIAIITGLYFRVETGDQGTETSWDLGACYEIAVEWVENGTYASDCYPATYPNNCMMIAIECLILKPLNIIGVRNYVKWMTIATALIISASVILSFYIVKKLMGRKKALLFMLIALFTTPLYLYAAEYYTDTFSMITTVLLFFIWIHMKDSSKLWKRILVDILYGVVLFFAIKIKLTSSFVFIAILFYEMVQGNFKKIFKKLCIITPVVLVLIMLFRIVVVNRFAPEDMRADLEIPTEHWIMMGMNGVGNYDYNEVDYTIAKENKTYKQRQEADRRMIMERLTTRSMDEHIKNLNAKLAFAWHDGTFWASVVLERNPVQKGKLHEFVLREYDTSKYYKYLPQTMHFAMLIFIFLNVCRIIKCKEYDSKDLIPIISMLGIMMFLLIWENRSRYLVNFIPLMLIAQINGIEYLSDRMFKKKREDEKK